MQPQNSNSIAQVINNTRNLARKSAAKLIWLMLAAQVMEFLTLLFTKIPATPGPVETGLHFQYQTGWFISGLIFNFLLDVFISMLFWLIIRDIDQDRTPDWHAATRTAFSKFLKVLLGTLVVGLLGVLAIVAALTPISLLIAGISNFFHLHAATSSHYYFWAWLIAGFTVLVPLAFYTPVMLFEKDNVGPGIKRAFQLGLNRKRLWEVFVLVILPYALILFISDKWINGHLLAQFTPLATPTSFAIASLEAGVAVLVFTVAQFLVSTLLYCVYDDVRDKN